MLLYHHLFAFEVNYHIFLADFDYPVYKVIRYHFLVFAAAEPAVVQVIELVDFEVNFDLHFAENLLFDYYFDDLPEPNYFRFD